MSLNKIGQVKSDKGFKKADLLVYGAIIIIVAVFLVVAIINYDNSPLTGFRIYVGGEAVFDYESGGEYTVLSGSVTVTEKEDGLELYIECGGGYNVVMVQKDGAVSVTEADCFSGTCVKMPQIKDNGGYIFCSAHALLIQPKNYEPSQQVPIG